MNTRDHALKFEINRLIIQKNQQYDHNNYIIVSASNNNKFMALSLARLTEYCTGNE